MSDAELDYYKILGLPRNATKIDICKAYYLSYLVIKSLLFSIILGLNMKMKINLIRSSALSPKHSIFSTAVPFL